MREIKRDVLAAMLPNWSVQDASATDALLTSIAHMLHAVIGPPKEILGALLMPIELPLVHLRGFGEARLLLAGAASKHENAFAEELSQPGMVIAFCLHDDAYKAALTFFKKRESIILGPSEVISLFNSDQPLELFKQIVRDRFPKRFLIPYSLHSTALANMFKGRDKELEHLWLRGDDSFAVVGPSKIGKSSLLFAYRRALVSLRDPRMHSTFYIDLSAGRTDQDGTEMVRQIALKLEPSRRAATLGPRDFDRFLRFFNNYTKDRVTLLLDEADEICSGQGLEILTMAVKRGLCRVVLSGRWGLVSALNNPSSFAAGRFSFLRLGPLDHNPAADLFFYPIQDLGLEIEDKPRMFRELVNISGCLPHYIQFIAGQLCNLACDENKEKLTLKDFTAVLDEFETASIFQSSLAGLDDPYALIVAIRLLDLGERVITESIVADILRHEGLPSDLRSARTLCDYLVIQNILSWSGDSFALASQGLKRYARKGILEEMRAKARQNLTRNREELS